MRLRTCSCCSEILWFVPAFARIECLTHVSGPSMNLHKQEEHYPNSTSLNVGYICRPQPGGPPQDGPEKARTMFEVGGRAKPCRPLRVMTAALDRVIVAEREPSYPKADAKLLATHPAHSSRFCRTESRQRLCLRDQTLGPNKKMHASADRERVLAPRRMNRARRNHEG